MAIFNTDKEKTYVASRVSLIKFILKYGVLYVAMFWMLFIGKTLALEFSHAVGFFIFIILFTILGELLFISKMFYQRLNNQYVEVTDDEIIRYDGNRKLGSVLLNNVVAVEEKKNSLHIKTLESSLIIPDIFNGYNEIKEALTKRNQS